MTNEHKALKQIADMDPEGIRADDLGRAARIARAAMTPSEPSPMQGCDVRDALTLYRMACDLCDEVGAADTLLGRPEVARAKAVALRDALGAWQPRTALAKPPVEPAAGLAEEANSAICWQNPAPHAAVPMVPSGPTMTVQIGHSSTKPPAPQAPAAQADWQLAAFVPIHPKHGPLWMDTYPASAHVAESRSASYPPMALYAAPSTSAKLADAALEVLDAYEGRFGTWGEGYAGPIDEEMKVLRAVLKDAQEVAARTAQREGS